MKATAGPWVEASPPLLVWELTFMSSFQSHREGYSKPLTSYESKCTPIVDGLDDTNEAAASIYL